MYHMIVLKILQVLKKMVTLVVLVL